MRKSFSRSLIVMLAAAFLLGGFWTSCGDDEKPRAKKRASAPVKSAPAALAQKNAANAPKTSIISTPKRIKHKGLERLEATRIGIGKVNLVESLSSSEFPNLAIFIPSKLKRKIASPDGRLMVWREKIDGTYQLVLSKRNGSKQEILKGCRNGYQPQWSPNSKNIAFTAIDWKTGKRSLYRYNLKSQRKVLMFGSKHAVGSVAAWSPSGTKIIFSYYKNLWIMNTNGIGKKMLDIGIRVSEADVLGFSKDGTSLAYRARTGGPYRVIDLKPEL